MNEYRFTWLIVIGTLIVSIILIAVCIQSNSATDFLIKLIQSIA